MSTTSLTTEITESLHDGHRRLEIQIGERYAAAEEHVLPPKYGGHAFWVISQSIAPDADCFSVDTEMHARSAIGMIAAVARRAAS